MLVMMDGVFTQQDMDVTLQKWRGQALRSKNQSDQLPARMVEQTYVLGSLGEQLPPIFGGTLETSVSKSQGKHRFHRSETASPKLPNMIAETNNIMIDATPNLEEPKCCKWICCLRDR